jgi:hypothetical protein
MRGIESETWLIFDIDNTDTNHAMTDQDNHGAEGGNVLYGDYHVEFVVGPEWGAWRTIAQDGIYVAP